MARNYVRYVGMLSHPSVNPALALRPLHAKIK